MPTQDLIRLLKPLHIDYGPYRAFDIASELDKIVLARDQKLVEASILHASRVLEVLTAESVHRLGLVPNSVLYRNLSELYRLALMTGEWVLWANALRRFGNAVRHAVQPVGDLDAELASQYLMRFLDWFLYQFPLVQPEVTRDEFRVAAGLAHHDASLDLDEDGTMSPALRAGILASPVIAATRIDVLLGKKKIEAALDLAQAALDRHPGDQLLVQQQALARSRSAKPKELLLAEQQLTNLLSRGDDGESYGILGGVLKRRWRQALAAGDDEAPRLLERAQSNYEKGYRLSRREDTYLGINAAATALWRGDDGTARTIASDCARLLVQRRRVVEEHFKGFTYPFWERATLAEAQLLQGDLDAARLNYVDTEAMPGARLAEIEVMRDQAVEHLRHLEIDAATFFARDPAPTPDRSLRIAVTGHRQIKDEPAVAERVRGLMCRALADAGLKDVVVISALAEGADQVVAEVGLSLGRCSRLEVFLPTRPQSYLETFDFKDGRDRFRRLLACADSLGVVPGAFATQPEREAAYESCGRAVIDSADHLLALWDGQVSRGRGGTAEIVEYARAKSKPVTIVAVERA